MDFITLTHTYSGGKVHIAIDKITSIRTKPDGRTLIIAGKDGMYVNETDEMIFKLIHIAKKGVRK